MQLPDYLSNRMALINRSHSVKRIGLIVAMPRSLSAWWLMVIGVVFHLVLAMSAELSPDEAHYALYGAHPDWSYFDHPPLVGWLQAPFAAIGGADLLMRIVPMVSWLITVRLMIKLCRRLALRPLGVSSNIYRFDGWVTLILLLSPMLNLLGVALVPDTLLMPLVPAVMSETWGLRTRERASNWRRWILLSVLLGACLLAKYTGIFIILGALLSLIAFHGQRLLRQPGAWLAVLIVVAMASPVVAWNAAHNWASFAYQSAHAAGDQAWQIRCSLRSIALQIALYGLLLPAGIWRALHMSSRHANEHEFRDFAEARNVGLAFGVPVLAVFAVMAGGGSSLPHWTACGWVALVPLAAAGCAQLSKRLVAGLALWQTLLLIAIPFLLIAGGLGTETGGAATSSAGIKTPGIRANPVTDVVGWDAAALHGEGLAEQRRARGLVVMNWSLASRVAWYARPMPVFVEPQHTDQFLLWFGSLRVGDSVVVVDWSQMPLTVPIGRNGFRKCAPIEQEATVIGGRQIAHFNYLYCEDWQGLHGALTS